MYYLNSQYLNQIADSALFFKAEYNLISVILILFTAFFLGFSFLIIFLSLNKIVFNLLIKLRQERKNT